VPRRCTICTHPERAALDAALVAGTPLRKIAQRFRASPTALHRHQAHLPPLLAHAAAAATASRADRLLAQLDALAQEAQALAAAAARGGDYRTALLGVRERVRIVELLAKLRGTLDARPQVNVLVTAEWGQVRAAVLDALAPYPAARAAVVARLGALETTHDPGE
jgi:hypothetical protein